MDAEIFFFISLPCHVCFSDDIEVICTLLAMRLEACGVYGEGSSNGIMGKN